MQAARSQTPEAYVHDMLVGWMAEHDPLALRELRMGSRDATTRVLLAWMAVNQPGQLEQIAHDDVEAVGVVPEAEAAKCRLMYDLVIAALGLPSRSHPETQDALERFVSAVG